MKLPGSESVAAAWVNALPGLDAPAATVLPAKVESWAGTGFVVVEIVGSAHLPDVPQRAPIVRCHCWAAVVNSTATPYGWADGIAQIIRDAAWWWARPIKLDTKTGFAPALVSSVWPVSEVQRIPDPDASRAHYVTDIGMAWVPVTP